MDHAGGAPYDDGGGGEPKEEPTAAGDASAPPPPSAVAALNATRPAEEDASKLELGREFRAEEDAQPIFLAEVAHLLQMQVMSKADQNITDVNPVLKRSLEYAEAFNQLTQPDHAINIRTQLSDFTPRLHPFEIAQLATLVPREAEEAKTIIPSLKETFDDNQLNDILAIFEKMI